VARVGSAREFGRGVVLLGEEISEILSHSRGRRGRMRTPSEAEGGVMP
jgi:hypothetical protein